LLLCGLLGFFLRRSEAGERHADSDKCRRQK
jgi:hypothetical protein